METKFAVGQTVTTALGGQWRIEDVEVTDDDLPTDQPWYKLVHYDADLQGDATTWVSESSLECANPNGGNEAGGYGC